MSRILVTGGTGYIGSHTVVELMQKGYDVVIVDNLSNSNVEMLDGVTGIVGQRPPFEQVDCNDLVALNQVFDKYPDIEAVIHFAASKAVNVRADCQEHFPQTVAMSLHHPEKQAWDPIFPDELTLRGWSPRGTLHPSHQTAALPLPLS